MWVSEAVRTIPGILLYVPWLRKKPENKKCKILDKRCFNLQRHHQNRQYHLLDLKTCQNTKDFALISGRVGDILWLSTLKHRLSRILHFLFSGFFLCTRLYKLSMKSTTPMAVLCHCKKHQALFLETVKKQSRVLT